MTTRITTRDELIARQMARGISRERAEMVADARDLLQAELTANADAMGAALADFPTYPDEQLAVLNRLADELLDVPIGAPIDGELAKEFVLRFRGLQATIGRGGLPSAWVPAAFGHAVKPDVESDTDTIAEEESDLTPDERAVIGALTDELQGIDEIARAAGVSTAVADRVLPIAEMAGIAITDKCSSHHVPPTYRRRPQSPYWKGGRA